MTVTLPQESTHDHLGPLHAKSDAGSSGPRSGPTKGRKSITPISYAIFGMSAGALLVAIGFAASRASDAHANILYWLGQILVFGVPVLYLMARQPTRTQAAALAVSVPAVSYVITESYSPIQFRFLDEFQHVQTAQSILQTHHLFSANTSLPVSPYFPGLEIVTTAFAQISHLSIYAAGTVIIGLAHVLTAVGLYLLITEIYDRPRLAALSVVFYSTELHYQFFDSYFTYETMALPFLIACLLAYVKMFRATDTVRRRAWTAIAVFAVFVTVVSHHVTSFVLLGFLVFLTVIELLRRQRRSEVYSYAGILIALALCMVVGWDFGVAHGVWKYLEPAVHSITGTTSPSTKQLGGGNHKNQSGIVLGTPTRDALAEYVATALLLFLVAVGVWLVWRNRRLHLRSLHLGFMLSSLSVFALLILRLGASDGSELAGRGYSFAMIPASAACSFALLSLVSEGHHAARSFALLRPAFLRTWSGVFLVLVLAVGGIAGGWPPYYARLPGPFLVSAWERSVDSHNLSAAQWAARYLPKRAGVASNWVTGNMLGELGDLSNVPGTGLLFLATKFTPELRTIVANREVRYVAVDTRILHQAPQNGAFFDNDPFAGEYTGGLGLPQYLDKFNGTPGVSKVYSDGTITIYDLLGSEYKDR